MSLLSSLGSLIGMAVGGPMGAALGSGLGTLATGGTIQSALNAGIGSLFTAGLGGKTGLGLDVLSQLGGGTSSATRGGMIMNALKGGGAGGAAGAGMSASPYTGLTQGLTGIMNVMGVNSDPILSAALQYALNKPQDAMSSLQKRQFATGSRLPNYRGTAAPGTPRVSYMAHGGYLQGPGTGTSDSIPAVIYQNGGRVQEARLSDGEFVMTADAVRGMGNGNRNLGAARMYQMMNKLEGRA